MSGPQQGTGNLGKALIVLWATTLSFLVAMGVVLALVDLDPLLRLLLIGAVVLVLLLEVAATAVLIRGRRKAERERL